MKVKNLKELLNNIPENMTQEQFDELNVLVSTGDVFIIPDEKESGVISFTGTCDEHGNELPEDQHTPEITAFAIIGGIETV
jgi:hypothetical protein